MIKIGDIVVLKKGEFDNLYRDPKHGNQNIIEYIGCGRDSSFIVIEKHKTDGESCIVIEPVNSSGNWQRVEVREKRFTTIIDKRDDTINKILK